VRGGERGREREKGRGREGGVAESKYSVLLVIIYSGKQRSTVSNAILQHICGQ